ncbi:MAG: hypothetical protein V3V22_01395, partial [Methylococcales bacterium]
KALVFLTGFLLALLGRLRTGFLLRVVAGFDAFVLVDALTGLRTSDLFFVGLLFFLSDIA